MCVYMLLSCVCVHWYVAALSFVCYVYIYKNALSCVCVHWYIVALSSVCVYIGMLYIILLALSMTAGRYVCV